MLDVEYARRIFKEALAYPNRPNTVRIYGIYYGTPGMLYFDVNKINQYRNVIGELLLEVPKEYINKYSEKCRDEFTKLYPTLDKEELNLRLCYQEILLLSIAGEFFEVYVKD